MIFGGRRATVVPLVTEAFDWKHGVFLGSTMSSEMTAAAAGGVGQLRFDPFAMLPFCGYNMAEYFQNWLDIGDREGAQLPKLFYVNWFRKDPESGKFLWPGFGENSRVLAWIFARCAGTAEGVETAVGIVPAPGELDVERAGHLRRGPRAGRRGRPRGVQGAAAAAARVPGEVRRRPAGGDLEPAQGVRGATGGGCLMLDLIKRWLRIRKRKKARGGR